ncbi:MAG: hypothetical protein FWE47_03250 [Oscillospiraceae bacterium]|nr:hypothetical protein [Oscillospiraceae bacterium]
MKKICFFLCACLAFSGFSAWVFSPYDKYNPEDQAIYKEIVLKALNDKYKIDIGENLIGEPTYAVKDNHGHFGSWKSVIEGEYCIYIYGDLAIDGEVKSYYGIYALSMQKVIACGIK